jgi:hypothetical protein
MKKKRISLGRLVVTPSALASIENQTMEIALNRHLQGDWGDVNEEERLSNDRALTEGSKIISKYKNSTGIEFWIRTEWDWSGTTVLLPNDL